MSARDPRQALKDADAAFQSTPLPPQALASLRRRVLEEPRPSRTRWLVAGIAVAAAVIAVLVLVRREPPVEDLQLAAGDHLAREGWSIDARASSLLHRDHGALALISGELTVSGHGRLGISHGTLEATGARFTVHQHAGGGSLEVIDGQVKYLSEQVTRELGPGESLEWPLHLVEAPIERPAPEPGPTPSAPIETPRPSPRPKPKTSRTEPTVIRETDAAWLLEQVDLLRSRREYGEAVRLLDKGLAGIVSPATRERFSFELGSILTYQQGDLPRACRHWSAHAAAFPGGRYAREVAAATEKARCASP